jgi:hypothetical protein
MKTKIILSLALIAFSAAATVAQSVEGDDMYFNSKDRAKLREQKAAEQQAYTASVKKTKKMEEVAVEDETNINPTDSYSARNVNPEFAARSNAETAQVDNQDYFLNDYQYQTASNLNNWNNNFNSWYSNPWYNSAYFGPSINNWNTPYYGYNSAYNSPWYDPYWNYNGWSTSFSYYWGNSWDYGWGGSYNYWNRPYCGGGWSSAWGPSWSYGGWYGYPSTIVVVNNGNEGGRTVSYGKRGDRGTGIVATERYNTSRTRSTAVTTQRSTNTTSGTNGRMTSTTRPTLSNNNSNSNAYYDRQWRSRSTTNTSGNTQSTPSRTWSNDNNNTWSNPTRSNDSGGRSNSSFTPSRSNSSFDGGSRSTGSGGSSSGGSRGRTRN